MNNSTLESVCVIGTGYVGLPMALILARSGRKVTAVDINETVVEGIRSGRLHIQEGSLQEIFEDERVRANLSASGVPHKADVFMIAVPTPIHHDSHTADLQAVVAATRSIVPFLSAGNLVILESTVPPRTCRDILTPILEESGLRIGTSLFLAHCPERILPGATLMEELLQNDRIIGAADATSLQLVRTLYSSVISGHLLETDDITAELAKLMENTYRDVNIALANQLHTVALNIGACPDTARAYANRHPRVKILEPGIGVGGHCIPIDPWFICEKDPDNSSIIHAARLVNDSMPLRTACRIDAQVRHAAKVRTTGNEFTPSSHKLLVVGATYKPNVGDVRESPALQVASHLRDLGYDIEHIDPHVPHMQKSGTLKEQCAGAAALVILVGHQSVIDELAAHSGAITNALSLELVIKY